MKLVECGLFVLKSDSKAKSVHRAVNKTAQLRDAKEKRAGGTP